MNDQSLPQLRVVAVVECPWCGCWTEAPDGVAAIRCDECRVEVPFADPEPLVHARAA
ncbi:MAG TPA: hypothetical protein VFS32_13355 [Candidatus Limnocylindrales bacterium]|nr:hypothetical protein [Candidatus Limnocylindrales bacterium]